MKTLTERIDQVIAIPQARVARRVDAVRRDNPTASPAELVRILERRYVNRISATGGGVGAAAAIPGVGTGTAVVLSSGQVMGFLYESMSHVLAVADVYGIPTEDLERRRTLLLSSLLGEEGAQAVQAQLGLGSVYWARQLLTKVPIGTVRSINRQLRKRAAKMSATTGIGALFGRLAPFGIGAAVGVAASRAMGKEVVAGVRAAFGPAPATYARALDAAPDSPST